MEVITEQREDKVCTFCERGTIDEVKYGSLYSRDGVTCHNHCMLLCSRLPQNGKQDSDGILRFLPEDILSETSRVHKKNNRSFYKCKYCKKEGATIGCGIKRCKAIFHFPCGLQNDVQYQFYGRYESYCAEHHRALPEKKVVGKHPKCPICDDPVVVRSPEDMQVVVGSCCKNGIFHKMCIQKYGLTAGFHHFKCPACNSENMRGQALKQGIFLPIRDALWELETDAYQDLMIKGHCEVNKCECSRGRTYAGKSGSAWELVLCTNCRAVNTHRSCSSIRDQKPWVCFTCRSIETGERCKKPRLECPYYDINSGSGIVLSDEEDEFEFS